MSGLGWTDEAACVDWPGLPWIGPRRGQSLDPADLDQMIETCAACPVIDACRDYVQAAEVTGGFWAGAWRHLNDIVGGRAA
ncbi:MAG TPA: WhiB family transcriptional regulator [Microlunatus sp.]